MHEGSRRPTAGWLIRLQPGVAIFFYKEVTVMTRSASRTPRRPSFLQYRYAGFRFGHRPPQFSQLFVSYESVITSLKEGRHARRSIRFRDEERTVHAQLETHTSGNPRKTESNME
jgi:hypothetical protein